MSCVGTVEQAAAGQVDATQPGTQTVYSELLVALADGPAGTAPPDSLDFKPYDGKIYLDEDVWLNFSVDKPAAAGETRFLQLENPRLPLSEIWARTDSGWEALSLEGPGFGLGSHVSNTPRVSVLLPPGPHIEVMVRMHNHNHFVPRMRVLDTADMRADTLTSLFVGGLGIGMMLLLVAYNAIIAVYTGDERYRLLSAYIGASLLFIFHYLGYGQVLIWGGWIEIDQRITSAATLFTFATYIPFAMRMLSLEPNALSRGLVWSMWLGGAGLLLLGYPVIYAVLSVIGGVCAIAMHPIAIVIALRGSREAWFFIGATLFSLFGGTTTWAEQVWGVGGGTLGHMFFLWGSVTTSIALGFLLAKHIVALREDRVASERTAKLAQAKADTAQQDAQAKGAFLATMSHEIRTPLNGVLGMAEVLSRSDLGADHNEHVATIIRSGRSLMGILNDILDYSKFESGELVLEQAPCDLFTLLDDVSLAATRQLQGKPVAFELAVDPSVSEVVITDPTRLRQILGNLVNNAVKFTPEGWVRVNVSARNDKLTFKVTDSGIGMSEEEVESLFERFRQADSSTTRKFGGTGLGLAICKLLCEAMHGSIQVNSQPGQGSVFEFWIPAAAQRKHLGKPLIQRLRLDRATPQLADVIGRTVQRWGVKIDDQADVVYDCSQGLRLNLLRRLCCDVQEEKPQAAAKALQGLKLLVAEDNKTNQLVVRKTLNMFGAEVELAQNGKEAVARFGQESYDLVLMDCEMPIMDGYTASETIRAQERSNNLRATPIVALTAHAGAEYRERALACGMNGYLSKPLQPDLLVETILACIARNEPSLSIPNLSTKGSDHGQPSV